MKEQCNWSGTESFPTTHAAANKDAHHGAAWTSDPQARARTGGCSEAYLRLRVQKSWLTWFRSKARRKTWQLSREDVKRVLKQNTFRKVEDTT